MSSTSTRPTYPTYAEYILTQHPLPAADDNLPDSVLPLEISDKRLSIHAPPIAKYYIEGNYTFRDSIRFGCDFRGKLMSIISLSLIVWLILASISLVTGIGSVRIAMIWATAYMGIIMVFYWPFLICHNKLLFLCCYSRNTPQYSIKPTQKTDKDGNIVHSERWAWCRPKTSCFYKHQAIVESILNYVKLPQMISNYEKLTHTRKLTRNNTNKEATVSTMEGNKSINSLYSPKNRTGYQKQSDIESYTGGFQHAQNPNKQTSQKFPNLVNQNEEEKSLPRDQTTLSTVLLSPINKSINVPLDPLAHQGQSKDSSVAEPPHPLYPTLLHLSESSGSQQTLEMLQNRQRIPLYLCVRLETFRDLSPLTLPLDGQENQHTFGSMVGGTGYDEVGFRMAAARNGGDIYPNVGGRHSQNSDNNGADYNNFDSYNSVLNSPNISIRDRNEMVDTLIEPYRARMVTHVEDFHIPVYELIYNFGRENNAPTGRQMNPIVTFNQEQDKEKCDIFFEHIWDKLINGQFNNSICSNRSSSYPYEFIRMVEKYCEQYVAIISIKDDISIDHHDESFQNQIKLDTDHDSNLTSKNSPNYSPNHNSQNNDTPNDNNLRNTSPNSQNLPTEPSTASTSDSTSISVNDTIRRTSISVLPQTRHGVMRTNINQVCMNEVLTKIGQKWAHIYDPSGDWRIIGFHYYGDNYIQGNNPWDITERREYGSVVENDDKIINPTWNFLPENLTYPQSQVNMEEYIVTNRSKTNIGTFSRYVDGDLSGYLNYGYYNGMEQPSTIPTNNINNFGTFGSDVYYAAGLNFDQKFPHFPNNYDNLPQSIYNNSVIKVKDVNEEYYRLVSEYGNDLSQNLQNVSPAQSPPQDSHLEVDNAVDPTQAPPTTLSTTQNIENSTPYPFLTIQGDLNRPSNIPRFIPYSCVVLYQMAFTDPIFYVIASLFGCLPCVHSFWRRQSREVIFLNKIKAVLPHQDDMSWLIDNNKIRHRTVYRNTAFLDRQG